MSSKAWYCSICESLLLNGIGVYCDCCGVCADTDCIKKANKRLQCKVITSKSEVFCSMEPGLVDFQCCWCQRTVHTECLKGLVDFQCCWCQRTVHTECLKGLEKECDFGPYKNIIVPPWCVQVARMKSSIHRHLLLRGVQDPGWENWCPLVVVANRKSGNNDGGVVLSEFRKYLNPVQVLDLAERTPAAALQWSVLVAPKPIKLLIAGGDGTVSWILSAVHKMDLDPQPAVSLLPLGTGNDLSRVLGWGKQSHSEIDADKLIEEITNAKTTFLDRWKVDITPYRHLELTNLGNNVLLLLRNLLIFNAVSHIGIT
ncbi:Diacylglycerol kinase catalytic domain [Popillia japonica]|uniref:Diacylglycerol kinase catalytic domain n=1 Tax=Popillia japonica TaxID=7064 RepID=A0AAW1LAF9_POPJA